jgi:pimeloyl-ACP methyl ester carboxylesterase
VSGFGPSITWEVSVSTVHRSTSQMADDAIAVIDYIGWNNGRELHIVGVSLGGMISQGDLLVSFVPTSLRLLNVELALKIPERILSLSLVVTKAGSAGLWANMTPVCYLPSLG